MCMTGQQKQFIKTIWLGQIRITNNSVRPILRIGEYSLVALQYRRIRYIGLRVSANTNTPAAITINSNRTQRLKHDPCRQNVTTNEAGISIHVPPYRLQVTRVDIKGTPPPGVAAGVNHQQRTKTSRVVQCVLCRQPR